MATRNLSSPRLALAGICMLTASAAFAQEDSYLAELIRQVDKFMPSAIKEDNTDLVHNLMGVELGTPLSKSFDYDRARAVLFGRSAPNLAPDCQRTSTPVGNVDQDECVAGAGSEGGAGAHKVLRFSKNMGLGNIKYMSRPPVPPAETETDPSKLAVKLSDQAAFDTALKFLSDTLGVPRTEMALPPSGVALPVKSLAVGGADEKGQKVVPVVINKVVHLPRGLLLPKPIPIMDPMTQKEFMLTKVPAPGNAWVVLADPTAANPTGIQAAMVSDWQELRRDDSILQGKIKPRSQLVQEIAERLRNAAGNVPSIIAILIGLSAETRGTYGLLLPAVQVFASSAARDPTEEEQHKLAAKPTAGEVFYVSLVEVPDQSER